VRCTRNAYYSEHVSLYLESVSGCTSSRYKCGARDPEWRDNEKGEIIDSTTFDRLPSLAFVDSLRNLLKPASDLCAAARIPDL
jgi:hypothetical protein